MDYCKCHCGLKRDEGRKNALIQYNIVYLGYNSFDDIVNYIYFHYLCYIKTKIVYKKDYFAAFITMTTRITISFTKSHINLVCIQS